MLQTGLGASVFSGGYNSRSSVPAAAQQATGPSTIGQQAFGIVAGDSQCPRTAGLAVMGGGVLALAALVFIWWSLPR